MQSANRYKNLERHPGYDTANYIDVENPAYEAVSRALRGRSLGATAFLQQKNARHCPRFFSPQSFRTDNIMVHITLPDGSKREFASAVTVAEVAAAIGSGLATRVRHQIPEIADFSCSAPMESTT